jgi:hypothetical protein
MASIQRIAVTAALVLLAGSGALAARGANPPAAPDPRDGLPGQSVPTSDKGEALSEAARKGDAAAVKKLLDEGVDVNTKYRYDVTALFFACDRGHLEVVKVLLDHGADVNLTDSFYHGTALGRAVFPPMGRKPEHTEIVALLLKHGAQGKDFALRAAVSAPDLAMTKVVLEQGGFSPDTLSGVLELATLNGHRDIAAVLEQAGAKPYVDFKMDEAQLARYAGTYRSAAGTDIVFVAADGGLTGSVPGQQRFTLAGRDETTFRIVGSPGATFTFRLEQGKAIAVVGGQSGTTYTRVEGK